MSTSQNPPAPNPVPFCHCPVFISSTGSRFYLHQPLCLWYDQSRLAPSRQPILQASPSTSHFTPPPQDTALAPQSPPSPDASTPSPDASTPSPDASTPARWPQRALPHRLAARARSWGTAARPWTRDSSSSQAGSRGALSVGGDEGPVLLAGEETAGATAGDGREIFGENGPWQDETSSNDTVVSTNTEVMSAVLKDEEESGGRDVQNALPGAATDPEEHDVLKLRGGGDEEKPPSDKEKAAYKKRMGEFGDPAAAYAVELMDQVERMSPFPGNSEHRLRSSTLDDTSPRIPASSETPDSDVQGGAGSPGSPEQRRTEGRDNISQGQQNNAPDDTLSNNTAMQVFPDSESPPPSETQVQLSAEGIQTRDFAYNVTRNPTQPPHLPLPFHQDDLDILLPRCRNHQELYLRSQQICREIQELKKWNDEGIERALARVLGAVPAGQGGSRAMNASGPSTPMRVCLSPSMQKALEFRTRGKETEKEEKPEISPGFSERDGRAGTAGREGALDDEKMETKEDEGDHDMDLSSSRRDPNYRSAFSKCPQERPQHRPHQHRPDHQFPRQRGPPPPHILKSSHPQLHPHPIPSWSITGWRPMQTKSAVPTSQTAHQKAATPTSIISPPEADVSPMCITTTAGTLHPPLGLRTNFPPDAEPEGGASMIYDAQNQCED